MILEEVGEELQNKLWIAVFQGCTNLKTPTINVEVKRAKSSDPQGREAPHNVISIKYSALHFLRSLEKNFDLFQPTHQTLFSIANIYSEKM